MGSWERFFVILGICLMLAPATARAQDHGRILASGLAPAMADDNPGDERFPFRMALTGTPVDLATPSRPRMAPELALQTYQDRAQHQLDQLGAYSDVTVIEANLPDTAQHGKYELRRSFAAPKSLAYAAIRFVGDGFVKTNVIARLLQSEVDHVQKGEGARTAITPENYRFTYKGVEELDGQPVYVFQVKPRQKRPGLFKGRIFLDVTTGALRRAEGTMVKSPSFFVKKLEFVQDYADVGDFSLPAHVHSVAKTRIFGRATVDIVHRGYEAKSLADIRPESPSAASSGVPASNN